MEQFTRRGKKEKKIQLVYMNFLAPEIQSVDADISHGTEMLMDP